MFYVIEQQYTGPNRDEQSYIDSHTYRVQDAPGCGNMSKQPILSGWIGTTNDWSQTAHGEYETLDDAKAAIDEMTGGDYREDELDDPALRYDMQGNEICRIVWQCRVGRLQPWTAAGSQDWCYESMRDCIAACTPYDEIESWARDCARDAEDEGGLLDTDAVIEMAKEYRDELAAAAADDEDADDEYTTEARRLLDERFPAGYGEMHVAQFASAIRRYRETGKGEPPARWLIAQFGG